MQDLLNAFSFISNNIHVAGWITLVGLAWKFSWKASAAFKKLMDYVDKGTEAAERTQRLEETINSVATNHLPHLQDSSMNLLEEIKGLRRDLLQILLSRKE